MRSFAIVICVGFAVACGSDYNNNPDASPDNDAASVAPRIIPGGGIGDGPIDGVVNLYVIDDATRMPISGATVQVGTVDGTTDSTGLFIAHGVTGAQTVLASSPSYRSEVWVGANGANITLDLQAATTATVGHANLSGIITGFSALTVAANHLKVGLVQYSANDTASDAANNLATTGGTNVCNSAASADCAFTITTRTGAVALVAGIYDLDTKGTQDTSDDTLTLMAWALQTGITVASGTNVNSLALAIVPAGNLNTETIDFGAPPSGLTTVNGVIGIETATDGVIQLPAFLSSAAASVAVPKLSGFPGATYRLSAFATTGTAPAQTGSVVLRRALTGATLSAGSWLAAPTNATATRTSASWTPVSGAVAHSVVYSTATTNFLNITVFDNSTSVTIPDVVALPAAGTLNASVQAIGAAIDVTNFSLDNDRAKLTAESSQGIAVN
ncbi:MAG TPA: hypothetical protein VGO00_27895 [Kofleriaceae bacterium]|nr:hypothetical protein [Kofleriaceae bacterium]